MALYKISDRYPNYRDVYFEGGDLKGMSVHGAENKKIGIVCDLLIDDAERLTYLVVDLGAQKQIFLPVSSCARTADTNSLYVQDFDFDTVGHLAAYDRSYDGSDHMPPSAANESTPDESVPNESTPNESTLSLYEERLSTKKQRVKTGEVRISKRTVTQASETNTPVTKEKVVIEIESIYGGDTHIDVDDAEVAADGSISMAIYEERTEICRQVRPYQNISVRKEVVEDVVTTQETLRREKLSVNPEGLPYVDWVDS